jgi:hypothetical protein
MNATEFADQLNLRLQQTDTAIRWEQMGAVVEQVI